MKDREGYKKLYNVDLLFGYLEKEGEYLYSSSPFIENSKLVYNYRRISKDINNTLLLTIIIEKILI